MTAIASQTHLLTPLLPALQAMAIAGQSDRFFGFGRRGGRGGRGEWTINGETFESARIVAADVGQNGWELWRLRMGGFSHAVHMHLVDFEVLRRLKPDGSEVGTTTWGGLRTCWLITLDCVYTLASVCLRGPSLHGLGLGKLLELVCADAGVVVCACGEAPASTLPLLLAPAHLHCYTHRSSHRVQPRMWSTWELLRRRG